MAQAMRNSSRPAKPQAEPTGWVESVAQEVLRPTYWFDPGQDGEPYSITVSFSGRRIGAKGKPLPGDRFTQQQTFEGIVPGSGQVSITAEIRGIGSGEWKVEARPVGRGGRTRRVQPIDPGHLSRNGVRPAISPRRSAVLRSRAKITKTALQPFARIPGVTQFAWAPLVLLGVAVGLAVQALLLTSADRAVRPAFIASVLAVVAGWIGAKVWYIAVHRGRRFEGWCIQGAILGGALAAAIVPAAGLDVQVGA